MVTDNIKQITIDRSIIILKALKKKPMTSAEIFRMVNPKSKIDRAELYHVLTKLTKLQYVEKKYIHSTKCEFTYLKDYPVVKVKAANKKIRPSQAEPMPTIPQSEWMSWKSSLVSSPILKEEEPTPMYKRSKEDIKNGIYRAEDRKGRWQVESTVRLNNAAKGGSLSGNSFAVGV